MASGGWTLHTELRQSRLTHSAEAGIQLPLLMTKGHHTGLNSLAIYATPTDTFDAVAAANRSARPRPPTLIDRPAGLPPTVCLSRSRCPSR